MIDPEFFEDDAPIYVADDPASEEPAEITPPPELPQFVEGLFDEMPFATYRSIEALSQSGAKKILRSASHFKFDREHPSAPTPAMAFGTFVHLAVLEPDRVAQNVCIKPNVDRRTKAGKIAHDDFMESSTNKIILTQDDYDRGRRCADAVLASPAARRLLTKAQVEQSFFWIDGEYKVRCKARLDIRSHGGISDLKTCADASPDGFAKAIANLYYHLQAAHYVSGAEHVTGASPAFFAFICVETDPPHAVATYYLDGASIRAGAHVANTALERYAQGMKTGQWPGYSTEIQQISVPRWALRFNV